MPRKPVILRNLPNALSIGRICAAPVLLVLVISDRSDIFKWLLLASLTSDILDGLLARTLGLQTELGARLDSIGDMSTYLVAILGVIHFQPEFISNHPIGIGLILGFYFLQKVIALLRFGRISSFHTTLARINAYMQGIFVMSLFLFGYQGWLFYPTVLVSVVAYAEETTLLFMFQQLESNVGGLRRVLKKRAQS